MHLVIARKQFKDGDGHRERIILELLKNLKHPNIIEFLGSYTQHKIHNLLFPFVPLNLKEFLRQQSSVRADAIYRTMYGLADALSQFHNFEMSIEDSKFKMIGLHHDLRPANILVQMDNFKFILIDFGLSQLKDRKDTSQTQPRSGSYDYLAPESFNYDDCTNGRVGRALDVWAFACIASEIATFIEGRSVEDFYKAREATPKGLFGMSDQAFHLDGDIRPAVTAQLDALQQIPKDGQMTKLIDDIRKALHPIPTSRPQMTIVAEQLFKLAYQSVSSAIVDAFVAHDIQQHQQQQLYMLYLRLEKERFDAWRSLFEELLEDASIGYIDNHGHMSLLEKLSLLDKTLRQPVHAAEVHQRHQRADLLDAVQSAIDELHAFLPSNFLPKFDQRWRLNVSEIDDIIVLELLSTQRSIPERYKAVGANAAMRYMARTIDTSQSGSERIRLIDLSCVETIRDLSTSNHAASDIDLVRDKSKSLGVYTKSIGDRRPVLIEWKLYDTRWRDSQGDQLHTMMNSLVNWLDSDVTPRQDVIQRVMLNCIGYIHDHKQHRFGFLYRFPDHALQGSAAWKPFSLNNILRLTNSDDELDNAQKPNLGDVFTLARGIASCVDSLHLAQWVHKSLSSHQILVFAPCENELHEHFSNAFLTGFSETRKETSKITLGPSEEFIHYQHPDYRAEGGFKRSFDYFSLGIILLELGLWLPISSLKAHHDNLGEAMSPEEFRSRLLSSYVPMLGEKMGAIYQKATRFCLDAESALKDATGSTEQEIFQDQVVNPLFRCVA
ncbi:hypothetical protein E8E14_005549 [Neopestalotiopsis sp. 37M]|nr:hypothetical protein E8E14_005549 [Neopestalotiopsis sp. 37M]